MCENSTWQGRELWEAQVDQRGWNLLPDPPLSLIQNFPWLNLLALHQGVGCQSSPGKDWENLTAKKKKFPILLEIVVEYIQATENHLE